MSDDVENVLIQLSLQLWECFLQQINSSNYVTLFQNKTGWGNYYYCMMGDCKYFVTPCFATALLLSCSLCLWKICFLPSCFQRGDNVSETVWLFTQNQFCTWILALLTISINFKHFLWKMESLLCVNCNINFHLNTTYRPSKWHLHFCLQIISLFEILILLCPTSPILELDWESY